MHPAPSFRAGLAALVLVPCLAQAAKDSPPSEPEVVVTANRVRLDIDRSLASVTVIDRARIERYGELDLVDLLRAEAGLDVVRTGGLGSQTSVFLRGTGFNQVLVLIDGVRVSSATTGAYVFEQLPLAQVERIEIVRGPRAALYGSDAIGGVIQIFTRRSNRAHASAGLGTQGTWKLDAGAGWAIGEGHAGLRLGKVDTEGFSAQNPRGFAYDPDRDGYAQTSASFDLGVPLGAAWLETLAQETRGEVEFDQGSSDMLNRQVSVGVSESGGEDWSLRASLVENEIETPDFFSRFETRRHQLEWQHRLRTGEHHALLWGLSWVEDEGASVDTASAQDQYRATRTHRAGFAAWRGEGGNTDWELAGRHDDYDGFGGRSSAQAALGVWLGPDWRLRGSFGQGFRAPNLNELYSPGFGGLFAGNPDLVPERSHTAELALGYRQADWQFDLALYDTRVRDLIDFSGGTNFQAINVGRARMRGAELGWRWTPGSWSLGGNLGWQQAQNELTGADLLRRAPRKLNLELARSEGAWDFQIDLHAAAARPDLAGMLPGYGVVGASIGRRLATNWSLALRLDNLFDRDYELARGFNAPGASALLQLRWQGG